MTTITIDRALLEQALEALKRATPVDSAQAVEQLNAITALRAALEQPQQEHSEDSLDMVTEQPQPVAWRLCYQGQTSYFVQNESDVPKDSCVAVTPLYTHPAPRTEPVAWMMVNPTHLPSSRSLHWEPQDWHITWQAVPLYTARAIKARIRSKT